jgi:hypothetical protein
MPLIANSTRNTTRQLQLRSDLLVRVCTTTLLQLACIVSVEPSDTQVRWRMRAGEARRRAVCRRTACTVRWGVAGNGISGFGDLRADEESSENARRPCNVTAPAAYPTKTKEVAE